MTKDPFEQLINSDFEKEAPSFDFTQTVMNKIDVVIEEKKIIKPLIPKKWMYIILSSYVLIFVLPISILANELTFSFLDNFSFNEMNSTSIKENLLLIIKLIFVFTTLILSEKLLSLKKLWA